MPQKFFLGLLLCFTCSTISFAQQNEKYREVDTFVKTFPINPHNLADLKVLQREIHQKFHQEDELVRAAYVWIASNIIYDCEGYLRDYAIRNPGLYEVSGVIATHKSICAGYATLFKNFCDEFGIECEIVDGFATGIGVDIKKVDPAHLGTNHAWNVVKVDDKWKLIDVTWGSGYVDDDCKTATLRLNEKYFYTEPGAFIKSHFPEDTARQLLFPAFTPQRFVDSIRARVRADSIAAIADSISAREDSIAAARFDRPDSVIRRRVGETIRFYFNTRDSLNTILVTTYHGNNALTYEYPLTPYDSGYFYDYRVTQPGRYKIEVYSIYDTHQDNVTYEGRLFQSYLLRAEPRKKVQAIAPPKKSSAK